VGKTGSLKSIRGKFDFCSDFPTLLNKIQNVEVSEVASCRQQVMSKEQKLATKK
jgi:hypothetical protein